jgi:hypothetical protein
MQLVNKRNLIIAGSVVVVLVAIGLLVAAQQAKKQTSDNNTPAFFTDTGKYDANSGETTSDIVGKTPDNFGLLPDTPVYLGLTGLLDAGLTMTQLNDVKYAFYQYTTSTNPKIKQVSFTKNSFLTVPPDANGSASMTFDVVLDSKPKMHGTFTYSDTESIALTLFDANNAKIFESGTVTNKSVESL